MVDELGKAKMTDKVHRINFLKMMRDLRVRGVSEEYKDLRLAYGLLDEEDVDLVMSATANVRANLEVLLPDAKQFEEAMEKRLKALWGIATEELG